MAKASKKVRPILVTRNTPDALMCLIYETATARNLASLSSGKLGHDAENFMMKVFQNTLKILTRKDQNTAIFDEDDKPVKCTMDSLDCTLVEMVPSDFDKFDVWVVVTPKTIRLEARKRVRNAKVTRNAWPLVY